MVSIRFFWVSDDYTHLQWKVLGNVKQYTSVPVAHILGVVQGAKTPTFLKRDKQRTCDAVTPSAAAPVCSSVCRHARG